MGGPAAESGPYIGSKHVWNNEVVDVLEDGTKVMKDGTMLMTDGVRLNATGDSLMANGEELWRYNLRVRGCFGLA